MPANAQSTFSVIGADIAIRGDIEATADLHADGTIIGNISCAALVQGETSQIEGEIRAQKARLSGKVNGRIDAADLVILKSARIEGDVSYDTLTIEQGASVNGHFRPHGQEHSAMIDLADTDAAKQAESEPAINISLAG